jgi:hypothetical protein
MFRPTWPSSGVYDISLFIPEGIYFAAFVAFVACCYSMQFLTELETSAFAESKRITNHNTPQLSRMDLTNHCAAFPGLSLLNIRAVALFRSPLQGCDAYLELPLPPGISNPRSNTSTFSSCYVLFLLCYSLCLPSHFFVRYQGLTSDTYY